MIFNYGNNGVTPKEIIEGRTITPGTVDQVIEAFSYITGDLRILGDSNLTEKNIIAGKTIFGVTGKGDSVGIVVTEVDSNGNPLDFTLNFPGGVLAVNELAGNLVKNFVNAELICDTINESLFGTVGVDNTREKTIKIKAKTLKTLAFYYPEHIKFWLSKDVLTMPGSTPYSDGSGTAFYRGQIDSCQIYCEAPSKPSGWGQFWNSATDTQRFQTTWGVTEEMFDSL